ncbi:MAG: DUF4160 domain-containing protein [Chloroflexi bacterium]|nr:DUF4160 domain-containing protein [Chloroflexota bacterium]
MPRISSFFGVAIYMYHRDHAPPHFHAIYGQYEAIIGIEHIRVLEGQLPRRVLSFVFEWSAMYQGELQGNWELAREHQPLQPIPPLD